MQYTKPFFFPARESHFDLYFLILRASWSLSPICVSVFSVFLCRVCQSIDIDRNDTVIHPYLYSFTYSRHYIYIHIYIFSFNLKLLYMKICMAI